MYRNMLYYNSTQLQTEEYETLYVWIPIVIYLFILVGVLCFQ